MNPGNCVFSVMLYTVEKNQSITHSLTHSPSLFYVPGNKAFASELGLKGLMTSVKSKGYAIGCVLVFVCLCVCEQDYNKSKESIFMKPCRIMYCDRVELCTVTV